MKPRAVEVEVAGLRLVIPEIRAGRQILLSGEIYTARDAAHARINDLLDSGGELPFDIRGAVI